MRRLAMAFLIALTALMLLGASRAGLGAGAAGGETGAASEAPTSVTGFENLYIFILAGFVGFEVISRVSPTLHTPLMSATNAISGISLVGSIVAAGGTYSLVSTILGCVAVGAAAINVVGGFMITDRMLRMFKPKAKGARK
jgi:NAD(P) transhydrogenase subunit alpha